jgi:hypothetical protein
MTTVSSSISITTRSSSSLCPYTVARSHHQRRIDSLIGARNDEAASRSEGSNAFPATLQRRQGGACAERGAHSCVSPLTGSSMLSGMCREVPMSSSSEDDEDESSPAPTPRLSARNVAAASVFMNPCP